MIYLVISLTLSLSLNILLLWYIRKVLYKLLFVSDNIDDLLHSTRRFSEHLERVHNMETYYGDQIIKNLIEHSKEVVTEIEEFEKVYIPPPEEGEEGYAEEIE
tara:strand:+ start:382 stop:690 length:309 start_codon:yes stop_codon:yes gene_type:complete